MKRFLRRYTDIPALIYLLRQRKITLLNPGTWEDKNDTHYLSIYKRRKGAVAELVGNEGGVVSGVFNLESSDVSASDWRPRHDKHYHEA